MTKKVGVIPRIHGDVTILYLDMTRLDVTNCILFKTEFTKLVEQGPRLIGLNLSKVSFIDSTGLGALVTCKKMLGSRGDLALCMTTDYVNKILRTVRMDKIFRIYPSESACVEGLNN